MMMLRFLSALLVLIFNYGYNGMCNGSGRQNAPVSTIGTVVTTGLSAMVYITAEDFINVRACNHEFLYDPSIAIATSITKGPALAGSLSSNLLTPGVITIGWFTSPGFTLPEGESVIFIITFSKVSDGTTQVYWNPDYPHRNWVHGNHYQMNDIPLEDYYISGALTFQGSAPITGAPEVIALPFSEITIPVRVEDFNSIGSFSLALSYDHNVMEYQSFFSEAAFPELTVSETNPGIITINANSSSGGISLDNNAILLALDFYYSGGNSHLIWLDDGTCQYTGPPPEYNVLSQQPFPLFYHNGYVFEGGQATLKLFLEGLFSITAGQMNKAKDFDGISFVDKYPGTIADNITVRLHDPQEFAEVVFQADDIPLDQNGIASFALNPDFEGMFYISVSSRNHLITASAAPVVFGQGNVFYDFSASSSQAYGDNMRELQPGTWGLFAGDVNQDGVVCMYDREIINQHYLETIRGYLPADINGDGIIDLGDREKVNDAYLQNIISLLPD